MTVKVSSYQSIMKFILILFTASLLTACSTSDQKKALTAGLDSLLAGEFNAEEPGGVVLVMKGEDAVYLRGFGVADMGTKEKITGNTLFNLGSISKTFVSNGILILEENGLLSLDDCMAEYFNDFRNDTIASTVTIKHLLSHTSGLPDNRNVSENIDFYITAKDEENFSPVKQADRLDFNPGQRYEYSNPAFNGLALIIEKVAGRPWQEFIRDSIFIPSGMVTSTITNGPHPVKGVAHAYEHIDGRYVESDYGEFPTFAAAGNGGVWSSVTELAMYEKAIRQNLFLGKDFIDDSRSVFRPENWAADSDPFIGYSWFIGEDQFLGEKNNFNVRFVYHTGDQGGFRAFYISIPDRDILYVGLFNRPPADLNWIIREGISCLENNNWLD